MEGMSLKSALTGNAIPRTKPIFWEHEGNRAMRKGDWKLVSQYDTKAKKFKVWELYNLKNDRSELNDQSTAQPEVKKQMITEYETWVTRVGVIAREALDKR